MEPTVTKHIKDQIAQLEEDRARNTVAFMWHEDHDSPEAQKQMDSAVMHNEKIDEKIAWLKSKLSA